MLRISTVVVTPFYQNARIVAADGCKNCIVVDPGGDTPKILAELKKQDLTCTEIWLTHSHLDHCGGVQELMDKTGASLLAHPAEAYMRGHVLEIAQMYGIPSGMFANCPEPKRQVLGGEELAFEGEMFKVLFTPGHSPGHVCFYHAASNTLLAGDTIFAGSIGRTDLPGGDHDTLLESIHRELLTLPPSTKVLSGHGPDTTIAVEKRTNPYLTGEDHV